MTHLRYMLWESEMEPVVGLHLIVIPGIRVGSPRSLILYADTSSLLAALAPSAIVETPKTLSVKVLVICALPQ